MIRIPLYGQMLKISKTIFLIREKYSHFYRNDIESSQTLIQAIIKDINLHKNEFHVIIRIQFSLQLVTTKTINRSQGLSLHDLAFDPTNVKKHSLAYIALSHIQRKETKLYLLAPLQHENFYVDPKVHIDEQTKNQWNLDTINSSIEEYTRFSYN